jgi:hypothetical protein
VILFLTFNIQGYCRWHNGRDTSSANCCGRGICLEHMIAALDFHSVPADILDC